jgi:hypothetical protein
MARLAFMTRLPACKHKYWMHVLQKYTLPVASRLPLLRANWASFVIASHSSRMISLNLLLQTTTWYPSGSGHSGANVLPA